MKNKKIIIGSRGSKLALIYAERAKAELLKSSEIERRSGHVSEIRLRTCRAQSTAACIRGAAETHRARCNRRFACSSS